MNKSVTKKRCSKCENFKSLSEFYKRKISRDGLQPICKLCRLKEAKEYYQTEKGKVVHRKANRKYQKTEKGIKVNRKNVACYCKTKKGKATFERYRIRHPKSCKARSAVTMAVRTNRLSQVTSLFCHYCLKPAQQYHHWHGYEPKHWLDVIPVCVPCHRKNERKIA